MMCSDISDAVFTMYSFWYVLCVVKKISSTCSLSAVGDNRGHSYHQQNVDTLC